MSKKSSKAARPNVNNVMGKSLNTIERIYAENCVVCVLMKDGEKLHFRPREALLRAKRLSEMSEQPGCPAHIRRQVLEICEGTVQAARAALHQQEDSNPSAKQDSVNRLLHSRKKNGAPTTVDDFKEDTSIQKYMHMYSTLTDVEISAVLRNDELDEYRKEMLMRQMHALRVQERASA